MSNPTNIARLFGSRAGILRSFLHRQPETKLQYPQLLGLGLARYAVIPFGNAEYGRGRGYGYGKWNFTNIGFAGAGAAVGVGTIAAFGISVANCAGKDKKCEPQCEDAACIRKMDKEEAMIAQANQDLENALCAVKPKAMDATEAALRAYCEAAAIMKCLMEAAYSAMALDTAEPPRYEDMWCEVYELAVQRCEKVKDAIKKGQCAWELLCNLREIVENGKACKYTSCNPLLITAEEFLLCAERELLNAKASMDCVQSDSKMVAQYRELVAEFREEMKAVLEANPPECKTVLSENECAMIIEHAYLKVIRIQKELAQMQVGMGKVPEKQNQTLC